MRKIVGFAIEEPGLKYEESVRLLNNEHLTNRNNNSQAIIELLGQQAEGLRRLSQLSESESLFRKTLLIARNAGILWGECWALWGIASVLRARGAHARSASTFRAALSVAKRAGDRRCVLWSVAELSELDRIAGRLQKALSTHQNLLNEFKAIGDWKGVCWASLGIAQIFRLRRELENARTEFKRSQELSSMAGNFVGAAWALRGQAEVARESGDPMLAIQLASTARSEFSSIDYRLGAAYALKTQADSLVLEGRIHEAATGGNFLGICGELWLVPTDSEECNAWWKTILNGFVVRVIDDEKVDEQTVAFVRSLYQEAYDYFRSGQGQSAEEALGMRMILRRGMSALCHH